ncbi:MAG: hypothetical protein HQK54_17175 [Oligoflexales bacterium]|nr:hypothetical protein [Oligoflexales bacterium]
MRPKVALFWLSVAVITGCAELHHIQLGDIDNRDIFKRRQKIDIKVSETSLQSAKAEKLPKKSDPEDMEELGNLLAAFRLFQMGPLTGSPVFKPKYADKIYENIMEKCRSGVVSGLTSIRETMGYPAVSGEIVKITGYCLMKE